MIRPALALSLLVPLALAAQEPAPVLGDEALAVAAQLRETALAGSGAYALVESLTTEVGPRMAGTPGDARAVAWAKAAFTTAGFDTVCRPSR
jgi:carboxypeptidase Q